MMMMMMMMISPVLPVHVLCVCFCSSFSLATGYPLSCESDGSSSGQVFLSLSVTTAVCITYRLIFACQLIGEHLT